MKDNDVLLISGGLLLAYLFLKPKPVTPTSTIHTTVPSTPTSALITQGGGVLTNLVNDIWGGNDTPAPATTAPVTTPVVPPASNVSSSWFTTTDEGDDWGNMV